MTTQSRRIVEVRYHRDADGWWADSPDAPGYTAAGETLAEVRRLAREGIPFFLEEDVLVAEPMPVKTTVTVVSYTSTLGYQPPEGVTEGDPFDSRDLEGTLPRAS